MCVCMCVCRLQSNTCIHNDRQTCHQASPSFFLSGYWYAFANASSLILIVRVYVYEREKLCV